MLTAGSLRNDQPDTAGAWVAGAGSRKPDKNMSKNTKAQKHARRVVHIVQLLCPERHCILAVAYESDKPMPEDPCRYVEQQFQEAVQAGILNPWCDICRSRDLHTEDAPTRFRTLEEARPHLKALEALQARTREFFRASRQ